MEEWKLPPKIKVLEALGAIADGRVHMINTRRAKVTSSDKSRVYEVFYRPETKEILSTDNGSLLKGYLGYPAIAFLMLIGELPIDLYLAGKLRNVPWKKLNETFKSYEKVMRHIMQDWSAKDRKRAFEFIRWVLSMLKEMHLKKLEQKKTLLDFF